METLQFSFPRMVDGFQIEGGIPIARDQQKKRHRNKIRPNLKGVFASLQVGESFVVRPEQCNATLLETQNIVSSAASQYTANCPEDGRRTFTTRQQGGIFVRCWRTQ